MKALLREIALTLILAIVIFLILQFTVQSFEIWGQCMEPNFYQGERLLVNKAVYHFTDPKRGDVIILHPPPEPSKSYIKRIIALPGDSIEVKEGAVYINGTKLDETYIKEPPAYTLTERTIPDNEYFVLGDNRNNSYDSYDWGPVSRENIIGKAWLSFWPIKDWGIVHHYPLEKQLASSSE